MNGFLLKYCLLVLIFLSSFCCIFYVFMLDGRWCDGEKAIPLKKRRGSYERRILLAAGGDDDNNNSSKKMKTRMKTKMNKKFTKENHNDEQDYEEGGDDDDEDDKDYEVAAERKPEAAAAGTGKKRARGSALMEGSRCSRVNGRGWRCCQQTLVGYSLCEHHLGKGRLRSMTSVRSRSAAASTSTTAPAMNDAAAAAARAVLPLPPSSSSSSSHEKQQVTRCDDAEEKAGHNGEHKDDVKPLVMKKRMKLGMVKARSISSLLGQTPNTEVVAVPDNYNK